MGCSWDACLCEDFWDDFIAINDKQGYHERQSNIDAAVSSKPFWLKCDWKYNTMDAPYGNPILIPYDMEKLA